MQINLLKPMKDYIKKTTVVICGNPIELWHYKRPGEARKILLSYIEGSDLSSADINVIKKYVEATKDCEDLDIKLDKIFTKSRLPYPRPAFGGGSTGPVDIDSNGGYSTARQRYEESGNNCCNMQPVHTPMPEYLD